MLRIVRVGTIVLALGLTLTACGGVPAAHLGHSRFASYVALGDSYTSAPLVPQVERDGPCLRSTHNYPSLVATELHVPHFTDSSCGQARTADMTGSQYPGWPPQFRALGPGTDLVTVGIGANDYGSFRRLVRGCLRARVSGGTCAGQMLRNGRDQLLGAIPRITRNVTHVLAAVHRRAPHATVVSVGYPQLVPGSGTCPALPFAAGDYRYALRVNRALNQAVQTAARRTHSTFIDIWSASKGHDICSSHPWINGIRNKPDALALHPFEVEQRAVAHLIVKALS